MSEELEQQVNPNPEPSTKQFSDEEISKILNTAKATRKERDDAAARAKELEDNNKTLQSQLEKIKAIDPNRYKQLEDLAASYEERKLEEQKQFSELKDRWSQEKSTLQQQNQKLAEDIKQQQLTNTLEKAFYSVGGKVGNDDDGYSYFDLVRDRAAKFIQFGEDGKMRIVDPRDGTRMLSPKGDPLTVEDLMTKLRSSGPTAALFEPANNAAGSGLQRGLGGNNSQVTREQLMALPRAERLQKARELGI